MSLYHFLKKVSWLFSIILDSCSGLRYWNLAKGTTWNPCSKFLSLCREKSGSTQRLMYLSEYEKLEDFVLQRILFLDHLIRRLHFQDHFEKDFLISIYFGGFKPFYHFRKFSLLFQRFEKNNVFLAKTSILTLNLMFYLLIILFRAIYL